MKTTKHFLIALLSLSLFTACDNDDDSTPDPVNEEEIITTLTMTLTPDDDSGNVVLQYRDLDGDGPDPAIEVITGTINANTTYSGEVVLLNETESPAEDITLEVIEEADEHQMFYIPASGLNLTVDYTDQDGDGNPLGVTFTIVTGDVSNGNLNVVLRHEPKKPNDGTLADAGGETDISVVFDVEIE